MTAARKRYLKFRRDLHNRYCDYHGIKRHDVRFDDPVNFYGSVMLSTGKVLKLDGYDAVKTALKDVFRHLYE